MLVALFAEASDFIRKLVRKRTTIHDLPNDVLVSIFEAVGDQTWVRHTFPLVCRAWNELYRTKDASPLHETLEVDFFREFRSVVQDPHCMALYLAKHGIAVVPDRCGGLRWAGFGGWRAQWGGSGSGLAAAGSAAAAASAAVAAAARDPSSWCFPPVHGPSVVSWAQARAGSVRKLRVWLDRVRNAGTLRDFSAEDLGRLVASARSSLTDIFISCGELRMGPFWESLRDHVVPAGRLRSLVVKGIESVVDESDVEPLGQLAGSLKELELTTSYSSEDVGLSRFPKSFCALTKLRRLKLRGHKKLAAIPAEISSLKKLEVLILDSCNISSLPKELGELSRLKTLFLSNNRHLGTALHADEAFPAELGKMKSLRHLSLRGCGLRAVPAFVGGLESLVTLYLDRNEDLEFHAPLNFLTDGCPRLHWVYFSRGREYTPESLARLEAFEAKLLAKNPNAKLL